MYVECDTTPPTSSPYTTSIPHIVAKMFALAFVVGHWLRPFYVMLCYVMAVARANYSQSPPL